MAKQRGRVVKKKEEGGLIITSLIDIFVILTIYLIQNFSSEGNLVANAENLTLPYSSTQKDIKEVNLMIAVTSDMILVDDQPVVPTEDVALIPAEEPRPVILKLEESLKAKHQMEEEMVKMGAQNSFEGKINIQVDKNIPFDLIYKVIYTASQAGYENIKLIVMKREV